MLNKALHYLHLLARLLLVINRLKCGNNEMKDVYFWRIVWKRTTDDVDDRDSLIHAHRTSYHQKQMIMLIVLFGSNVLIKLLRFYLPKMTRALRRCDALQLEGTSLREIELQLSSGATKWNILSSKKAIKNRQQQHHHPLIQGEKSCMH